MPCVNCDSHSILIIVLHLHDVVVVAGKWEWDNIMTMQCHVLTVLGGKAIVCWMFVAESYVNLTDVKMVYVAWERSR